jgi:hypothetical protein
MDRNRFPFDFDSVCVNNRLKRICEFDTIFLEGSNTFRLEESLKWGKERLRIAKRPYGSVQARIAREF